MEFDKNRVYTALNADELKVGSTVIVANDLRSLRAKVEKFDNSYEFHLSNILSESDIYRFEIASEYVYVLAYLISPPKEPQYDSGGIRMKFDKNRVYTALNADELKVGSTVIVANDLRSLRAKVEKFDNSYEIHLSDILSESAMHRFETSSGYLYVLAYLISPPKESTQYNLHDNRAMSNADTLKKERLNQCRTEGGTNDKKGT